MDKPFISLKTLVIFVCICLFLVGVLFIVQIRNTQTLIVFCDVGQGDGAYIRIRNKIDIVIDSGPDRKILDCLGRYMPFYDRKIEFAFLSHPQKDHYGGFEYLFQHYSIGTFFMNPIDNSTSSSFRQLKQLIEQKNIQVQTFYTGDSINLEDATITSLWPDKSFVKNNVGNGIAKIDLNQFSQFLLFTEKNTSILFTGDFEFNNSPFLQPLLHLAGVTWRLEVLKIPHHGSKNGLTEKALQIINPQEAIISVGKNNSYGHPSKQTLDLIQKYNIGLRRTDKEGNVVFRLN